MGSIRLYSDFKSVDPFKSYGEKIHLFCLIAWDFDLFWLKPLKIKIMINIFHQIWPEYVFFSTFS